MQFYFIIRKLTGEQRVIKAFSLQDIIRKKNNYRRSPHFKGSYFSKIFSDAEPMQFNVGDMMNMRWK
jgi:hypothetical protein